MMFAQHLLRVGSTVILALTITGCALLPSRARMVQVRSAETPSALSPVEGYYRTAKDAIERRDYATALDYLQLARARNPKDARVWNALGVVYDKLGRFDLSARYYGEALALEPGSSIVASNMAYSSVLQTRAGDAAPAQALARVTPLVAPVASAAPPPNLTAAPAIPVAQASAPAEVRRAPILLGRPLVIVNASGQAGGADSARKRLAGAGWSVAKAPIRAAPLKTETTIRFPERHKAVAEALAQTLPVRPRLAACPNTCSDVELIVGTDAARWRAGGVLGAA